jgi:hypothetical protein
MRVFGFDWDRGNREKCRKHGVTITEIEESFQSPVTILGDVTHSSPGEIRYLAVGVTAQGRYVFTAFTIRQRDGATLVRPISARFMHRKEVAYYEKEAAKTTLGS